MATTPRSKLSPLRVTPTAFQRRSPELFRSPPPLKACMDHSATTPKLFDYSQTFGKTSPYRGSPFQLTHTQLNTWVSKKCPASSEPESDTVSNRTPSQQSSKPCTPMQTGKPAFQEFYLKYHSLKKGPSPHRMERKPTAIHRYLKEIEELKQVPHPMGIVKWAGSPKELNLESYKMGNKYAAALSKGLRYMSPEAVNLSDNRLTKEGSEAIIAGLRPTVKTLNVSQNSFDQASATTLGNFIKTKALDLKKLDMESTKLGDLGTAELCKYIAGHQSLTDLNLSTNKITDSACEFIANLIRSSTSLQTLSLHWNLITGNGGARIMHAAAKNPGLKVLDLSWNSLGKADTKLFALKLSQFLGRNEGLIHLDISNNGIKVPECTTIANALMGNHSLLGFHVSGNKAFMDSKGYMKSGENLKSMLESKHLFPRIQGGQMIVTGKDEDMKKYKKTDNCWICEGWNEILFEFPINPGNEEPVFLHLECDEYSPELMCLGEKSATIHRMCPPGKCKFFFIFEGKAVLSPLYSTAPASISMEVKLPDKMYPKVLVELDKMNYIEVQANPKLVNDDYEITLENCMPRPVPGQFHRKMAKRERKPWSIPISVFRHYIPDSAEIFRRCFEEDWKHIIKPKMKEESLNKCKELLRNNYKVMYTVETYKYYAAIGRTDTLFAINRLTLTDFIAHKIQLFDGDKLKDMDLAFMTIKGKKSISKFQPKTALVRFEFLEMLLRLALKKYFESKQVASEAEAVEKLINDHIIPNCSQFNSQSFRKEKYWNEECDNLIKSHYDLFENLYETRSGRHKLPGEKPYMAFDEFLELFSDAGLVTDEFPERDVMTSYAQAMITQVDELGWDRHMKMQKVEFYEAIARAADALSLAPPGANIEEWSMERRQKQLLWQKMDNLIPTLLSIAKKEFRERFRKPEWDDELELYVVPYHLANREKSPMKLHMSPLKR